MAKWFFITCLLVTFCGFAAGRPAACVAKNVSSARLDHHQDQPSFSEAMHAHPLSRLVSGALIVPDSGFHQGTYGYMPGGFVAEGGVNSFGDVLTDDPVCKEPVLRDHFQHLFPFFHFW